MGELSRSSGRAPTPVDTVPVSLLTLFAPNAVAPSGEAAGVAAQRFGVKDRHRAAPGSDAPERAERRERLDGGFARGAAPARQLVLRQRQLHDDSVLPFPSELLAELEHPPRDPAERVERRE